jgi:hypothetical protein
VTFRRNKGKLRSEPARRGELRLVAPTKGGAGKDRLGRFTRGNKAGGAKGFTASIGKMLGGKGVADAAMQQVGRDAWRMNGSILRELPSTGAIVRANVALLSMHSAVAGYFNALALAKGLDTPEGMKAIEAGRVHGQRVSQLSVVVLDLSACLAAEKQPRIDDAAIQARLDEYNRRNTAAAENAPPEGAQEPDGAFAHEGLEPLGDDGDGEPEAPDPEEPDEQEHDVPEHEPESAGCAKCGDPDPLRGGISKFCCTCGATPAPRARREGMH